MPLFFANTIGLWALAAIPILLALHAFVHRAPPRTISSLMLWSTADEMKLEGKNRRRPPTTWVLILEILALLLLTAALCEPRWLGSDTREVAIIVDTRASMQAHMEEASAVDSFADELQGLSAYLGNARITLVASAKQPVVSGRGLSAKEAAAAIRNFDYVNAPHSLTGSFELLRGLGFAAEDIVVLTGRDSARGISTDSILIRKSKSMDNIAWVGGGWAQSDRVFAVIQNFSDQPRKVKVVSTSVHQHSAPAAGESIELELAAGAQRLVTLRAAPSVDGTAKDDRLLRVELVSQEPHSNGLEIDDSMFLQAPSTKSVTIRSTSTELTAIFKRVSEAIVQLNYTQDTVMDIAVMDGRVKVESIFSIQLLPIGKAQKTRRANQIIIDPASPLMEGFESEGLVWYFDPRISLPASNSGAGAQARVLLRNGQTPLIWQTSSGLEFNLDKSRSNFFRHAAFPILMENLTKLLLTTHRGLQNRSLITGADSSIGKSSCKGILEGPGGRSWKFGEELPTLYLGAFNIPGRYRWRCGDSEESFALHFSSSEESNLLLAPNFDESLTAGVLLGGRVTGSQQSVSWAFVLLAMLCALFAWLLLRRRDA